VKQILQSLKTGATEVIQVPVPKVSDGRVLIHSLNTLVSTGTEKMLVEFGKAGWIEKAHKQPDKVRMVIDKIKTDGLQPTLDAVFNKLDQPLPLGYCNVGCIGQLGKGVQGFEIGERVISNGQHAEAVTVPFNLCARVPNNVSDEEAAFTVLGAIALQGIRLIKPTLGEAVVVTGLGLIGLLTVQLLKANGCRVLGIDYDTEKLKLAREFGAEVVDLSASQDPIKSAELFSRHRGVDAVLVTAATKSSEPIHQAALMCRKRGRIVLVGVTGLELLRDDFFKKELTFQVSASYGPGRYDPNYEEKGQDYPIGFVRWTEQRNFEAVLDMMAEGRLDVKPLISHRFMIDDSEKAYELMFSSDASLGILLKYPEPTLPLASTIKLQEKIDQPSTIGVGEVSVSFLGAGNYATAVLIPAFKKAEAKLRLVASSNGVSGLHAGRKFCFEETTTDSEQLFLDDQTNAVVIASRHNSHSQFVLQGLRAGKHIFVEKPLCLTLEELAEIENAYAEAQQGLAKPLLMVGFNRRFAPQIKKMKELLNGVNGPKAMVMTINAGAIPKEHWTQDLEIGGGRIIGEVCHFIDLLRFLAGAQINHYGLLPMDSAIQDTISLQLSFIDGSIGTIHYFSNGSKSFPKERLEVFAQGRIIQLENFRKLTGYGWGSSIKMNLWRQDKGQKACAAAFVKTLSHGGVSPINFEDIREVSRVAIELAESASKG
jgi:predicted dehydrogenase/threonine dehydrogenase-like Zn-dependent dehydrogenase